MLHSFLQFRVGDDLWHALYGFSESAVLAGTLSKVFLDGMLRKVFKVAGNEA